MQDGSEMCPKHIPKSDPGTAPEFTPNGYPNGPKTVPEIDPKTDRQTGPKYPNSNQTGRQNEPKTGPTRIPKWTQNGRRDGPPGLHFVLIPRSPFDTVLGPGFQTAVTRQIQEVPDLFLPASTRRRVARAGPGVRSRRRGRRPGARIRPPAERPRPAARASLRARHAQGHTTFRGAAFARPLPHMYTIHTRVACTLGRSSAYFFAVRVLCSVTV